MQRMAVVCVTVAMVLMSAAGGDETIALLERSEAAFGWSLGLGEEFPGAQGDLAIDEQVTHNGKASLRLTGDFSEGGNYVQAGRRLADLDIAALSLWVKYPRADALTLRITDSSDQCHQINLRIKQTSQWQHVRFPLRDFFEGLGTADAVPGVVAYEKWGGPNDGKWHGPATGIYILSGPTDQQTRTTELWLNGIIAETGRQAQTTTARQTVRLDEFLQVGEKDWEMSVGQEYPGAKGALEVVQQDDTYCLKLSADFTEGGAYVETRKRLDSLNVKSVESVNLQMRSENVRSFTVRFVDATGQCHQKKNHRLTPDGDWHEIALRPGDFAEVEHWGGANDGKWHPPAQLLAILVNTRSAPDTKQPVVFITDITASVMVQATAEPDAFHEGFEGGQQLPEGWVTEGRVFVDGEGAFAGDRSLCLHRAQDRIMAPTRAMGPTFAAAPGPWQASAACRSDLYSPDNSYNGTVYVQWLDGGGELLERDAVASLTGKNNWRPLRADMEAPDGTAAGRFAIELNKTYGSFHVDELSAGRLAAEPVAERIERILLSSDRVGNLLYPDDEPVIHMTVEANRPLQETQRAASYVVTDYWGAEQGPGGTAQLRRAGERDQDLTYTADLDLSDYPLEIGKYYEVHVEIARRSGPAYREFTAFSRLPQAVTKQYEPAEIPFTSRNWDNRIREYFLLSDRLGIRVCGIWGGWSEEAPYEPQAPRIDLCRELDMGVLTGTPGADVERNGFENYDEAALRQGAKRFVSEYEDDGLMFVSLGNEPHGGPQKVRENVRAYKAVYEGVKAADPDMTVIGSSMGPEEEYFKAGFAQYLDQYDFHTYGDYQGVRRIFETYERLFAEYGDRKPIVSTELGLNSQGMTRHAVAKDLIKKLTLFFACGGDHCSWFTILYPDPEGKLEGSFGQAHNVFHCRYSLYNPKLDAIAYYNMVNGICVKDFVAEAKYADGTEAYLFKDSDDRCLQVVWNEQGRRDIFLPLAGVRSVKLVRIDGSFRRLDARGRGITMDVCEEPVLLLYEQEEARLADGLGAPAMRLASAVEPAVKGGSVSITLSGGGLEAGDLHLEPPPSWAVSDKRRVGDGVRCTLRLPEKTEAAEGRVRVELRKGDAPAGEFFVTVPVASPIEAQLLPVPSDDDGPEVIALVVTNNADEPQQVSWTLSLTEAIPMGEGSFDLGSGTQPEAYFTKAPAGRMDVPAGAARRAAVPLANVDPLTIYRVKAIISEAGGRSTEHERFVGGFARAASVAGELTLDGKLSEEAWRGTSVQYIRQESQYCRLGGENQWDGPADLSAELRFLWDSQHLYLGVEVTDDVYNNGQPADRLWAQDGLQLLVDPARAAEAKAGKYDYSAGVGRDGPAAWCHLSADPRQAPAGNAEAIRVAAAAANGGTGSMSYEVAIPWRRLSPFRPASGADIGLSVILNEDDGGGRDAFMGWFGGVHLKQLDMVGDVILTGED